MIAYLSLCKLETSCSCFLSCVTIFSHSALASWYCSRARASRSSAFCRASFSFSRSASALSRSVVSIDLIAFKQEMRKPRFPPWSCQKPGRLTDETSKTTRESFATRVLDGNCYWRLIAPISQLSFPPNYYEKTHRFPFWLQWCLRWKRGKYDYGDKRLKNSIKLQRPVYKVYSQHIPASYIVVSPLKYSKIRWMF